MTAHDCPRIDDAASYVLRAMADGEWEEYQFHLGGCTACTTKVAELGFVTHAMLSGVPQFSAPPAIRDRVMATVRAESQLLRAAGASADVPVARPSRRWRLALRPLPAAALASVLLALGIGSGVLLTGGDGSVPTRIVSAEAVSGTAKLHVGDGSAKLVVAGLPAPPEGRIYQVWLDHPNDRQPPVATDALFSVSKSGRATVDVPSDLTDVSAVLVTDEPIGGSQIPTGQKAITVRLT